MSSSVMPPSTAVLTAATHSSRVVAPQSWPTPPPPSVSALTGQSRPSLRVCMKVLERVGSYEDGLPSSSALQWRVEGWGDRGGTTSVSPHEGAPRRLAPKAPVANFDHPPPAWRSLAVDQPRRPLRLLRFCLGRSASLRARMASRVWVQLGSRASVSQSPARPWRPPTPAVGATKVSGSLAIMTSHCATNLRWFKSRDLPIAVGKN